MLAPRRPGESLQDRAAAALALPAAAAAHLGDLIQRVGRGAAQRRGARRERDGRAAKPRTLFAAMSASADAQSHGVSRRRGGEASCGFMFVAAKPAKAEAAKKGGKGGSKAAASPKEATKSSWSDGLSLPYLLGNMAAGATAGACVETALYPIDTIKTRLQAVRGGGAIVWGGLYTGLAGNIAGVIPASALFMGVYEPLKRAVLAEGYSPLAAQFAAATAAGTAASLVRVPTEVVKQRMQTGQFTSAISAVRSIVAKEGLRRGLYAGYGSFMLRDLPFDAIEFVAYEQMKVAYRALVKGRELNPAETSGIGAAAGVATAVLTTPLDVIKTRLMTQGATRQYAGVLDCARKLVAEEGAGALFKGVGPRMTWIGIGGGIFFPCLEAAKSVLIPKE